MRPLAVVCDLRHAASIRQSIRRLCHPQLHDTHCLVIGVDVEAGGEFRDEKEKFFNWVSKPPEGITEGPFVTFTLEASRAMRLSGLVQTFNLESKSYSAGSLMKQDSGRRGGTTPIEGLLNQCGLSLASASAALLRPWGNSSIDRNVIDDWLRQFGLLRATDLGRSILGSVRLYDAATLGNMLADLSVSSDYATCVNVDPRGNSKSGDVVRNLLTKRQAGRQIGASPAELLESSKFTRIAIFEDGLWSGTEAIGIFESLLGRRNDNLKTKALSDTDMLRQAEVVLAYGVGTDYGRSIVTRYLLDNGLSNVRIEIGQEIQVSTDPLRQRLKAQPLDWSRLREMGPEPGEVQPYVIGQLTARGVATTDLEHAKTFLSELGSQLWVPYNDHMATIVPKWQPWPLERRERASLGQHGLGLAHGFGHSIPKASLPIFWYGGEVKMGFKTIKWKPLFKNAA